MNLIKSQQFQELLAFHSAVMTTTLDSILDDFRKMTRYYFSLVKLMIFFSIKFITTLYSEAENHDTIQEKVRELLTTLVSKPNAWMCLANSRPDGEFNDMWLLVKEAAGQLTDLMTLSRSVELITPNERYPVSSILNKLLVSF